MQFYWFRFSRTEKSFFAQVQDFGLIFENDVVAQSISGSATEVTSKHADFTKFFRIVVIDVRNDPGKCSDPYLKDWLSEQSVKCRKRLFQVSSLSDE